MSDDQTPHPAIRIRLEIEIPSGASEPKVETSLHRTAMKKRPPGIAKAINKVEVACRIPGASQARVTADGLGMPHPDSAEDPHTIHGLLLVEGSPDPGSIPPGGSQTTPCTAGAWEFAGANLLSSVDCTQPATTYRLWIWHEYSDGHVPKYMRESTSFKADCYGVPDCGELAVMKKAQAAPIEVLAYGWKVEAKGFAGPGVKDFNGAWKLFVSQSDGGGIVIASRPRKDGASVRLRSDERHARWTLEFRKGDVGVRYALAAPQFQTTGRNTFSIQGARGTKSEDMLPAGITVEPA